MEELGIVLLVIIVALLLVGLLSSEDSNPAPLKASPTEELQRLEYKALKEIHDVSNECLQRVTGVLQAHAQGEAIDEEVLRV